MFLNRSDAGRRLARQMLPFRGDDVVVIGLPRGGVVVAAEVARALGAPLDVWVVRKIGAPHQSELGIGALAEGGAVFLDSKAARLVAATEAEVGAIIAREQIELDRRVHAYRRGRPPPAIEGRTVILVDDGIATGGTARAALQALRSRRPKLLVLAVPVAAIDALEALAEGADEIVCLEPSSTLRSIGEWYNDFGQTSDEDVVALLDRAEAAPPDAALADARGEEAVSIQAAGVTLAGDLHVPAGATGLVVFAHGSGSSRHSPRNLEVAAVLRARGLATLLFDLLTPREDLQDTLTAALRFDVGLLGARLIGATDWLQEQPATRSLALGYFGASTGAAAALLAAAERPAVARAVVSRGGRPDLAGPYLERVEAPVLLIVGGRDHEVFALNRVAAARLHGLAEIAVVAAATHLFEEPGALAEVAQLAGEFFARHLAAPSPGAANPPDEGA
jgi:putative phosphoribosyl transferase